jgi:protein TonB
VEKKPEFPGGESELLKYFSINLKYPEFEKDCIVSKIRFTFTIDTVGKILNPEFKINECIITDTYKKGLINLIENMPNWTPGENKGKKVNVKFSFPLNIDLKY